MERINYTELPKGIYDGMLQNENYLRKSGIDPFILHLIKIRSSQLNGCGYCLDMHMKEARRHKMDTEKLDMIAAWQEAPIFTKKEKAILTFTEALTWLDPEKIDWCYQDLQTYFNKTEIANLALAVAQINSWNRLMITFGAVPGSYKAA